MKRMLSVLALAVLLGGCSDPYGTAAKLAQDVAVSINQANIAVDTLRVQGALTSDEERSTLNYLGSIDTADGVYIGCVQSAHANTTTTGGFTACAQSLSASIGNPSTLSALHISNAQSQQKVTALVQAIITLVSTVTAALGGR